MLIFQRTWRTFPENHVKQLVSVDLFVVPTVNFRVLFVFLVLAHKCSGGLHFNDLILHIGRIVEVQAGRMDHLAEVQRHTDERLGALINVVERDNASLL